jgi:hypothetical protein
LEDTLYHVLLEGRRVGPYDRRTIVGMRIKKALTSAHVLQGTDGSQLTVADLVKKGRPDTSFQPSRSGSYSVVQATYPAGIVEMEGAGLDIPGFKGEVEARVQTKVLRISGRYRQGLGWKEDRVKLPLDDVVHARLRGTLVDLWLRAPHGPMQRLTLELFTPEAAGEFAECLPQATPWPEKEVVKPVPRVDDGEGPHPMVWAAVVGTALIVAIVLAWVLTRRF